MTTATQTNRELVLNAIGSLLNGDVDGFRACMHPEVDIFEPDYLPYGGHYRGVDSLLGCFGEITAVVDVASLEVVSVIADEETAVLLTRCKLCADGSERLISEHWRIENDRVREVRVFWSGAPA